VILVDSSVWVDHFRRANPTLRALLEAGEVATHPMILGELACGGLPDRAQTLHLLRALPALPEVPGHSVWQAIETHRWFSKGIGWIDAHLLAAALVARVPLWTLDRRLARLASSTFPN